MQITNVQRTSQQYSAEVEVDDRTVARIERGWSQGGYRANDYIARSGHTIVATGRTLAELREELREWLASEYTDARDSW